MSPEQARGLKLDTRSDLFSLGAVLYEMATQQLAFSGDTTAVILDGILNRPPVQPKNKLHPKLNEIIEKLLEKDRDLRYQSAAELRADLKRLKRDAGLGGASAVETFLNPLYRISPRRQPMETQATGMRSTANYVMKNVFRLKPTLTRTS